MPRNALLALFTLIALLTPLAACGDEETPDDAPNNSAEGPPQGLRVFYALDDPSAVDLLLIDDADAQLRVDGIQTRAATPYTRLAPSLYRASFFQAGTTSPLDLNIAQFPIEDASVLTLAVSLDEAGEPRPQLFDDPLQAPPEGMSRLRIVCLANTPALDVVEPQSLERWAESLRFGQLDPYTDVPIGTIALNVQLETGDSLLDIEGIPLRPAENSTLFILGTADPNGDGAFDDADLSFVHTIDHTF